MEQIGKTCDGERSLMNLAELVQDDMVGIKSECLMFDASFYDS